MHCPVPRMRFPPQKFTCLAATRPSHKALTSIRPLTRRRGPAPRKSCWVAPGVYMHRKDDIRPYMRLQVYFLSLFSCLRLWKALFAVSRCLERMCLRARIHCHWSRKNKLRSGTPYYFLSVPELQWHYGAVVALSLVEMNVTDYSAVKRSNHFFLIKK